MSQVHLIQLVFLLSLPCQPWQLFFLSCVAMLHYYQGPSASHIWERRLKHQQFSRWVSSLARRDERSHCSPLADSPAIGLCRHRAAVSRAARPVMWTRWQENRQVPSKPPGARQQWFSVWTSSPAQYVLYCCWTVQPLRIRERVFDPGVDSHSASVFPTVAHLFLLSVSLSHFLCVSCFSHSLCTPVFLLVYPTVSIPLSHLSTVCFQRDSDLADADWKGDGHC